MVRSVVAATAVALVLVAGVAPVAAQQPGGPPPSGTPSPPSSLPGSPPPTTVAGQGPRRPDQDPPEVQAAADLGVILVAEEATVLDSLGAFAEPVPDDLGPVVDEVLDVRPELAVDDRDFLLDELADLEAEADDEDVLAILVNGVTPVDQAVVTVLSGLDDEQVAAVEAGETGVLDASVYLQAIDSLGRNGRPGLDPNTPPLDGDRVALQVRGAYLALVDGPAADEPAPDASEPASPTSTAPAEATTTSTSDDGISPWVGILVVVVVLGLGAVVVVAVRRRRPSVDAERFDDLLDLSRRLASARNASDVERIAAAEAARLVDASASAVVHRDGSELRVGTETDLGLLVGDRLGDGLLRRVVDTGQPVSAVVRDEPAVRHLPVAMVAVPVIGEGRVNAVVTVVRPPDRPFSAGEVDVLRSLGPVLAAALDSARHAEDAASASLTDALTGVANRRKLEDDLPIVLAGEERVSLVMVDLDHFKAVNDRFGHPAGDAVLRQAAEALVATVRPGDRVYRYGGEEFAVVLPSTAEPEAVQAAERLREAVAAAAFDVGSGEAHRATASFGVACAADGDDALSLVSQADRALYRAKEGGRDRVVAASTLAG